MVAVKKSETRPDAVPTKVKKAVAKLTKTVEAADAKAADAKAAKKTVTAKKPAAKKTATKPATAKKTATKPATVKKTATKPATVKKTVTVKAAAAPAKPANGKVMVKKSDAKTAPKTKARPKK